MNRDDFTPPVREPFVEPRPVWIPGLIIIAVLAVLAVLVFLVKTGVIR